MIPKSYQISSISLDQSNLFITKSNHPICNNSVYNNKGINHSINSQFQYLYARDKNDSQLVLSTKKEAGRIVYRFVGKYTYPYYLHLVICSFFSMDWESLPIWSILPSYPKMKNKIEHSIYAFMSFIVPIISRLTFRFLSCNGNQKRVELQRFPLSINQSLRQYFHDFIH